MLKNGEKKSIKKFEILLMLHLAREKDLCPHMTENALSFDNGMKQALFKNYLL